MRFWPLTVSALGGSAAALTFSGAEELKEQLAREDHTLVTFVATETDDTKSLLSEWKLVQQSVDIARVVNCTTEVALCRDLDVISFPSIRLHRKDATPIRYRGNRKARAILSFVDRALQPSLSLVDHDDLEVFYTSDDVVIVAYIDSAKDASFLEHLTRVAEGHHDQYTFGVVDADAVVGHGQILCFNNIDATKHESKDVNQVGALESLMKKCTEPLIPQLTRRNELSFVSSGKSLVYFFSDDEAARDTYTESMKPVAKTYQEFLKLVTVDSVEYPDMARNLGIHGKQGLAVRNLHNGQVFPFDGTVVPDKVAAFIVAISKGEVQPWDGTFPTSAEHDEL